MKYTDYMSIEEYVAIMSEEEWTDLMIECFADGMAKTAEELEM